MLDLPQRNGEDILPVPIAPVPVLPNGSVCITVTVQSAGTFPTGHLAIAALNELRNVNHAFLRAVSCRSDSCQQLMARLQAISQFVGEIASVARHGPTMHLLVMTRVSFKKSIILDRLLLPYGQQVNNTNGIRGTMWSLFDGTEQVPTQEVLTSAVRLAVKATRILTTMWGRFMSGGAGCICRFALLCVALGVQVLVRFSLSHYF